MKKANKQGITGLPNFRNADNSSGSVYSSLLTGEDGYGPDFMILAPNPFGQDTEAIVVVRIGPCFLFVVVYVSCSFQLALYRLRLNTKKRCLGF